MLGYSVYDCAQLAWYPSVAAECGLLPKSPSRSEACCIWRLHQPPLAPCSPADSACLTEGREWPALTSTHDCGQNPDPGLSREGQHAQTEGDSSSLTEQLASLCEIRVASCSLQAKAYQLPMFVNKVPKTGTGAPVCNPSTWKAEVGGCEFEASLGYGLSPW